LSRRIISQRVWADTDRPQTAPVKGVTKASGLIRFAAGVRR
jgi:hypothetical protein